MVLGIGVDVVEIESVGRSLSRWDRRWLDKIFTDEEQAHCSARANPVPAYAARFAAKEAVYKALPVQPETFRPKNIVIVSTPPGKPFVKLEGPTAELLGDVTKYHISISLSHSAETAAAMAIIQEI